MDRLEKIYRNVLESNQRMDGKRRYTVPSSRAYPHQWLWDSCFHAIIYTHFDIEYAKDEIRSLLSAQWENGMLPHIIYSAESDMHRLGTGETSSITQPPMIAYAVERIYREDGDAGFVEEVVDALHRYYSWIGRERMSDGLAFIIHPWESGEDDLVSWDDVYRKIMPSRKELERIKLRLLPGSGRRMEFKVLSLSFNSIYIRNLDSMLALCRIAGSGHVGFYRRLASKATKAFRKRLRDKETGLLFSVSDDGRRCYPLVSSLFLPLFAGALTKKEAGKLIGRYLLDEGMFWLRYPVPTVSAGSERFEPERYWRGSTWININWFIVKGLESYGYMDIAGELKKRSRKLVERSGFHEYFNPINGRGLGPDDFTWSGLVFDM